jgi:hypothetical protein
LVTSVAFTLDGRPLLCGNRDKTVTVCDLTRLE